MDEIQVLEGQEAEAAIARLNQVVSLAASEEGSPDVAILKQDGFVAAPVIHTGTLSETVLEKIFEAAKTTGHSSMTAMGLYSPEEYHCYELPMTLSALNELRGTSCGVINFALFAGAPDWLVLFDDQLYVAYGSPEFVTALVGDIDGAYKAIEDRLSQLYKDSQGDIPGYAKQEINRMGEYLDAAYGKLTDGYAKADVGERVFVL
ncbi:MAG: hypothetical protein AAFV85_25710 [Cyanobacteria bacterium J06634_6]